MDVPSAPSHAPFVPADLFLATDEVPVIVPLSHALTYAYTSIEGLGWPLPAGGEYNLEALTAADALEGYSLGYIESLVATQWACHWLSARDDAEQAEETDQVAEIEGLLANFWDLPHVAYLTDGDRTYYDQMLAEVNGDEDLVLDRLWSFGCQSTVP